MTWKVNFTWNYIKLKVFCTFHCAKFFGMSSYVIEFFVIEKYAFELWVGGYPWRSKSILTSFFYSPLCGRKKTLWNYQKSTSRSFKKMWKKNQLVTSPSFFLSNKMISIPKRKDGAITVSIDLKLRNWFSTSMLQLYVFLVPLGCSFFALHRMHVMKRFPRGCREIRKVD